jgi:hypothetical protein
MNVAAYFAKNGSLSVNDGPVAVGRAAIVKEAQAFMTTFPDMVVTFDKLEPRGDATAFHWTLTGNEHRTRLAPENAFESAATNSGGSTATSDSRVERPLRQRRVQTPVEFRRCWLMRSELFRFNTSTLQTFSVRPPGNNPRLGRRGRRGRKLGRRQTQTPQRRTSETQSRRSRLL